MDRGKLFERIGVLTVRLIVVAATLIGVYLVVGGASLLHRVFGAVIAGVGLYLLYHHAIVHVRGSMEA